MLFLCCFLHCAFFDTYIYVCVCVYVCNEQKGVMYVMQENLEDSREYSCNVKNNINTKFLYKITM